MMKKIFIRLMFIVAIATMNIAMVSCSKDNDTINNGGEGDKGGGGDPTSEIYQDPSLYPMNENQFLTKVPTLTSGFDQTVVDALQANDRITDVKPYKRVCAINGNTGQATTVTTYFFNYKQDIDHNNPSKGTFKQQCVLSVAGKERPTVLRTHGYALGGGEPSANTNRIDTIMDPYLVSVLNANCLHIEHRYQGWSLPEGWTNKWTYLNTKQQSDDIHAIVTAIKKSGIISEKSKWISTGVSKDGETSAFYAYHYPQDMAAYVPYCAPFMATITDPRPFSYILSGVSLERIGVEKLKAAFREFCSNKTLQQEVVNLWKSKDAGVAKYADEAIRLMALRTMFDNHFQKMSYVHYANWTPMIPQKGDSAEKFLKYILANSNTNYEGESEGEYKRRVEDADDEPAYGYDYNDGSRAEQSYRFDPFDVQCCIDLGSCINVIDWVSDLLTTKEKEYITGYSGPSAYGVTYDNGAFIKSFLAGMKTSQCHMYFVYGEQDPWTGGRIPDENLGPNSHILMIKDGLHNDYCDYWTASERSQLFQWLAGLGFDMGQSK